VGGGLPLGPRAHRPGQARSTRAGAGVDEVEAEELLAVALQHEIDHLDGRLFLDRLSRLKRDLYRARQRKLERQGRKSGGARPLLI